MIARKAQSREALYSCGDKECAEEVSYPADMLCWCARCMDFFCEYHECFYMEDVSPGTSLEEALTGKKP